MEINEDNFGEDDTLKETDISFENKLSKKYDKKINTIYEINFDEDNYFSSWDEIKKDYKKLKNKYNKIGIAYHHYASIEID